MTYRNEYIDIVKGIAIWLVVVGHCVQYGAGKDFFDQQLFYGNLLFKFIYTFHMPLFMLISGYLFFYSMKRPTASIIWKKTRAIIIPLVSFQTTFLIISYFCGNSTPLNIVPYTYLHTLWFLRALFLCCMIVLFINRVFKDKATFYLLIVLLLPFVHDRILPDVFAFTMPYFIIGYLFNKYKGNLIISTINRRPSTLWAITGLLFALLLLFFKDNYYAYVSKTYLFNGKNTVSFMAFVNIYRHLTACAGCAFILLSISLVYKKIHHVSKTILTALAKASICIYIVNSFLNENILLSLPFYLNYLLIITESICILAIGYGTYWLLKRKKISSFMFLGGR